MISTKGVEHAKTLIGELLMAHADTITEAYRASEDSLKINLGVKFSPNDKGPGVKVDASINFINGATREKISGVYLEGQGDLFVTETEGDL